MSSQSSHDEENAAFVPNTSVNPKESHFLSWDIISNMLLFFFAMIIMELSLEGAGAQYGELDSFAAAVTLFQFGYCFALPMFITRGKVFETFPSNARELFPYVKLSLLVFGATALSTRSIKYVSYPTKVVFKSAKLIPTMIISTILNKGSKYGKLDYLSALLLCLGAAGFSFGSMSTSTYEKSSYIGLMLLTTSVICDALVPNLQQQLMNPDQQKSLDPNTDAPEKKKGLSAPAVMINVNAVGFVGVSLFMLANGSFLDAGYSTVTNPDLLVYLNLIGLGLSTAVLAYTKLIKASNSVTAVTVATVRKVATILLSYIVFPKPIHTMHVISGFFVLGGIMMNSYSSRRR